MPKHMVLINGGTFTMGSPANEPERSDDEGPRHEVTISPFYMGKYPVTQGEYQAVTGANPSELKGDNLPVENVSWYEAIEYCNSLSQVEGLTPAYTVNGTNVKWNRNTNGYRLPTEAEWEYACRAGTSTPFYSGKSVDDAGWYLMNSDHTHPVGEKQANAWGLYDMHGNVWEWCWDRYRDYSRNLPDINITDPEGAQRGPCRVLRGGGWRDLAQDLRSAYRRYCTPFNRYNDLGFRLAAPGTS